MVIRVRVAWVHPQIRRLLHTPRGAVLGYWYTSAYMAEGVRWRITRFSSKSGAIGIRERVTRKKLTCCAAGGRYLTLQEVVRIVDRPQEIENDAALTFFGGSGGDADESQG